MKAFALGLLFSLFLPYVLRAEEVTPQSKITSPFVGVDVVTVYHRFGYEEADQPFRIMGPLLVEHHNLEALIETLAKGEDVLIEVCPLKPLQNHSFGFYWNRDERKGACITLPARVRDLPAGESR